MEQTNIPALSRCIERLAFLKEAFDLSRTSGFDEEKTEKFLGLLYPNSEFKSQPFHNLTRMISNERGSMYYKLIDAQCDLAQAGMVRVRSLHKMFNFYARDILGGDIYKARQDIHSQDLDVSIMFSLSDSALKNAAIFADESSKSHEKYVTRVHSFYADLYAYKSENLDDDESLLINLNDKYEADEQERLSSEFEFHTLDVANKNLVFCERSLDLLSNQIRGLYHWRKALESVRSQALGDLTLPACDIAWEEEGVELVAQRVQIASIRSEKLYQLSQMVSGYGGM